jgi:predicted 3-demethylubiquinone-9 3-methyltransferase (glyoxalase superfamily)
MQPDLHGPFIVKEQPDMPLTPSLLVAGLAEEMATYYTDVFPDGEIKGIFRAPGPDGTEVVITANIVVNESPLLLINGGEGQTFTDAFSFVINCRDQEEVDYFWNRFVDDGGAEIACGWCTDKFGFHWQVTPDEMPHLLQDPDPERAGKAMQAMMGMKKIDLADMRAAMGA